MSRPPRDPDKERELRLLMGGEVPTSDGRKAPGLSVSPAQAGLFGLGPVVEVRGATSTELANDLETAFTAEGFTLTARNLPEYSLTTDAARSRPASGLLVADRDVAPNVPYNRWTNWVSGGMFLAWILLVALTALVRPDFWIQMTFLGAFVLVIPAFLLSSYRGRGYTSVVLLASLQSTAPPDPRPQGGSPPAPMSVTLGIGRVQSRQPIGRNLGGRHIVRVDTSPQLQTLLNAVYARWRGSLPAPA
ncbi:MAG TPA: hypothetical protein VFG07_09910 [Thermoplasmata archaeon]|nr:hypothetical protein [Thermoplasmata archaeon]